MLSEPRTVILSAEEEARAARFKFEKDRVRWTRARSSLRAVLAIYTRSDPAQLVLTYGEHGKPSLNGFGELEFNLSHAGEYALIAVSQRVPVGIDIERMRPNLDMRPLLERLGEERLPETRVELYQRWTIRESRSKAAGGALFDNPQEHVCAVPLDAPEGYSAAVALVGATPSPVTKTLVASISRP